MCRVIVTDELSLTKLSTKLLFFSIVIERNGVIWIILMSSKAGTSLANKETESHAHDRTLLISFYLHVNLDISAREFFN